MNHNSQIHRVLCCLVVALLVSACGQTPTPTSAGDADQSAAVEQSTIKDTAVPPTEIPPTDVPPTATEIPSATPVPPTATAVPPTATARPSPTPKPGPGDVLFSMPDDGCDWSPFGWNMSSGDDYNDYIFENTPDQVYIEVPDSDTVVYAECWRDPDLRDVQIDMDVANIAGPNLNNISVVCRMNDRGWYEAAIDSGGYWYLYFYSSADGYETLDAGGSTAINMQLARNHLTLVCAGDTLSFYVNDVALGSVTDVRQRNGHVAISVTTFELKGAGIAFEAFQVTIPDPDNLPGG